MKRFDCFDRSGPVMNEDVNGAWIRYADHVEAMKRIAGDSAQEPDAWIQADHLAQAKRGAFMCRVEAEYRKGMDLVPIFAAPSASAQQVGEEMVRFCPECGSLGDVPAGYQACCPDASHARIVPKRFAEICRDTFRLLVDKVDANPIGNLAAPAPSASHVPSATPMVDTAPMYQALIESRLALCAVNSGASQKAISLIDAILNAAPVQSEIRPVTPLICPKCHALWLFWPREQTGDKHDSLNMRSAKSCDFCERASASQLNSLNRIEPSASPAALTDAPYRKLLAALVDIHDDAWDHAPEHRTYVEGAFKETIDEARALLAASPADQVGWQPIETAPMDGTPVLLYARSENARAPVRVVGWWIYGQRWVECAFAPNHPTGLVPTHWMPLLAPPQAMSASKEGA